MAAAQLPSLLELLSADVQKEALSPLELSQSCHCCFEVTAFHDIYEISICCTSEKSVQLYGTGLQQITRRAIVRENVNFRNGARPRLSVTLHDIGVHGH